MGIFSRKMRDSTAEGPAAGAVEPVSSALEERIRVIGNDLLDAAEAHRPGWLASESWSERLMDWAMSDPAFKVQMFRFVDVFPVLQGPKHVYSVLSDYLAQPGVQLPPFLGLGMAAGRMARGTFAKTVAGRIEATAARFIAGRDAESALPVLRRLWDEGAAFSVDLLGEACLSDAEATAYRDRYLDLVRQLPRTVADWPANTALECDHLGPVPRCNVSIKISAMSPRISPADHAGSLEDLHGSLRPVFEAAGDAGVLINFDMEQYALKDLTLDLFEHACEATDFEPGIALQAYLRSAEEDAKRLIDWTKRSGRRITVRLIKGAYWDYETAHAERMGWPVPVWSRKRDTDACFERIAAMLLDAAPRREGEGGIKLALGSHNIRSIAAVRAMLEQRGLPEAAVEYQLLYGMAGELREALVDKGLRVRMYVPVGEMIPGMAYLVRRLLENTSNESWLRSSRKGGQPRPKLLASPHTDGRAAEGEGEPDPGIELHRHRARRHALSEAVPELDDGEPFISEPWRDFARGEVRQRFERAIGAAVVPRIEVTAGKAEADEAVGRAREAFPGWSARDPVERARCLLDAAEAMRQCRDELAGIIIRESGKPWVEADADVCEAIDFCSYYAREAVGLFRPRRLGRFAAELNHVQHRPLGVAAVISPWNFPLAITAGMTVAALVTGNTVVLKPAEQSPGIASRLCEMLWQAGVGRDELIFLPGIGETAGAALVNDPRVAMIAFTGSREVGLGILEAAGKTAPDQRQVKRVVCEMGGKNAIIVDDTADFDEAVPGVRYSAFGYAGQRCSACSRAIVVDSIHDRFLERLAAATAVLRVGDPIEPGTDVPHLIDEEARRKVQGYIDMARQQHTPAYAGEVEAGLEQRVGRPLVAPHIFSDVKPSDRLAQEEVFGPVLAVLRAADFQEALAIANDSPYRLTGGVYSRTPAHLALTRQRFDVGDLYLNRPITGSLVGRQPFGGFGHSGTGTQAGGPEYLLHFVRPAVVSENTMRRGFAPDLS